jgi:superfamily II DNA or RNA helicase
MRITRQHIRNATGSATFTRGHDYFERGRVTSIEVDRQGALLFLRGETLGSGNHHYIQDVQIEQLANGVEIDGECSCPVGYNCKHVAAVCLSYERDPGTGEANPRATSAAAERWLQELATSVVPTPPEVLPEFIAYLLIPQQASFAGDDEVVTIEARAVKRKKNGTGLTRGRRLDLYTLRYDQLGVACARATDRDIARLLCAGAGTWQAGLLDGELGFLALNRMLDSGRCFWGSTELPPLTRGARRTLNMAWIAHNNGASLELDLKVAGDALLLPTSPATYLDPLLREVGQVEVGKLDTEQLEILQRAPLVPLAQAAAFSEALVQRCPELGLPLPRPLAVREIPMRPPTACLTLAAGFFDDIEQHVLLLDFDYAGARVAALPIEAVCVRKVGDDLMRIARHASAEAAHRAELEALGFMPLLRERDQQPFQPVAYIATGDSALERASRWSHFIHHDSVELQARGWRIDTDDSFEFSFESAELSATIATEAESEDWFELGFELNIGDEKLSLLEALAPLLDSDWTHLPDVVSIAVDGYRHVDVPVARLTPVLDTLRALFDTAERRDGDTLRLSRYDAATLVGLEQSGLEVHGGTELKALAQRLSDFDGIKTVDKPVGLNATLRDYQQRGLDWLQFLREYACNGVLADDMGLGKTVQTLAHLLVEKNAGRLQAPALLIAPTSLMGNWQHEAQRFCPSLRVLLLHGADRHQHFDKVQDSDLVLTTYPLLSRDGDQLRATHFHSVILDEAQMIKNPRAKAAQIVRQLKCDHRLCLTGTPMENHLGELWALFDFLMPGFLGSSADFNRRYRVPIERDVDTETRNKLARRIRPFMLRRTKQEVASELPPKTEIVQLARFEPPQAELYESIRVAMNEKVRKAIARQGLQRSHITILDALLKLRQTCCDPRLLPQGTATHASASAKFELLFDLLPAQLEEGRRILLFSQFTSMLALIEAELARRKIAFTKLTGQTKARDDAIARFRSGEVNLFLISLKAGGVGLNLSEADTVIHYDPWWNPAAEAQATDRAHRIGQQHPVFVYKLIVENSVEEKLLALQLKKRALADGLYQGAAGETTRQFDADDLAALLGPV